VRVVVVGAGIVGAAVAFRLAAAGVAVTVLEADEPASGATGASFGWIGAGGTVPPAAAALHAQALPAHRRLAADLPGAAVTWSGSLAWGPAAEPSPSTRAAPDARWVDAAGARAVEPGLLAPPGRALHTPSDGFVDAAALTRTLLDAVRRHGGEVRCGHAVLAVDPSDACVRVTTAAGGHEADAVVLAAGTGTAALCAALGTALPVTGSPATLLTFPGPAPGVLAGVVSGPGLEVRPAAGDRLLGTGDDPVAARDALVAAVRGAEAAGLPTARVGVRPMPAGGTPLVGPLPGHPRVHVAVTHSGVTLAPAVAECVAREVVDGVEAPELRGCRPRTSAREQQPEAAGDHREDQGARRVGGRRADLAAPGQADGVDHRGAEGREPAAEPDPEHEPPGVVGPGAHEAGQQAQQERPDDVDRQDRDGERPAPPRPHLPVDDEARDGAQPARERQQHDHAGRPRDAEAATSTPARAASSPATTLPAP